MPGVAAKPYTTAHDVRDDGTVTFLCSQNVEHWPWLALDPHDPIVVQTVNYWASVECGAARGTFDPNKWSALTLSEWKCGDAGAGHPARGMYEVLGDEDRPGFQITFFNADGALIYRIIGKGVVFHNRDFEGWRAKAKAELAERAPVFDFAYAPCAATGMPTQWQSFLSALSQRETLSAQALITAANGFRPAHLYHSGSGDHVNANHLADISRQFAQAVLGGRPLSITGGDMTFKRYVELGQPFDIALAENGLSDGRTSMTVSQAGQFCSAITVAWRWSA